MPVLFCCTYCTACDEGATTLQKFILYLKHWYIPLEHGQLFVRVGCRQQADGKAVCRTSKCLSIYQTYPYFSHSDTVNKLYTLYVRSMHMYMHCITKKISANLLFYCSHFLIIYILRENGRISAIRSFRNMM